MHIHPTLRMLAFCVHELRYNVVAENWSVEYPAKFFCSLFLFFLFNDGVFFQCKLKFDLDCVGFRSILIWPVLRQGTGLS